MTGYSQLQEFVGQLVHFSMRLNDDLDFHAFGAKLPVKSDGQAQNALENGQVVRIVEHSPDAALVDPE